VLAFLVVLTAAPLFDAGLLQVLFDPEGVVRPAAKDDAGEGSSDGEESDDELGGAIGSQVEFYEDGGKLSDDDEAGEEDREGDEDDDEE
jgi:hypothetical protein